MAITFSMCTSGGTWLLTESDHGGQFELPDFLITDRRFKATASDPTAQVVAAYERRQAAEAGSAA